MTDREETFKELTKQYKEKTGVDVRFELYAPTAAYTAKIRAAAQASKLPDVYGVLMQMRDFAAFIKADHIYDLTPYMEADEGAWRDVFFKSALEMNSFTKGNQYNVKPGIYGVPID
ncbi:MAG: extracellular solute-binding protein, partial [Candidatus Omnitrophica bacterium]|nr:extracellular solute-binding protein [Candidatus Omnitrophota bacterium]